MDQEKMSEEEFTNLIKMYDIDRMIDRKKSYKNVWDKTAKENKESKSKGDANEQCKLFPNSP